MSGVEKRNKYIEQKCVPIWTYLRYYRGMFDQQNINININWVT